MAKRRATPRQLENLKRGREILFEKQRIQKGIPRKIFQKIPVQVPVPGPKQIIHVGSSGQGLKVNLSLFDKLFETKLFPIEINNNKEILSIKQIIDYILRRLNLHWNIISSNERMLNDVSGHINSKDKEYEERFRKLEKRISELEKGK